MGPVHSVHKMVFTSNISNAKKDGGFDRRNYVKITWYRDSSNGKVLGITFVFLLEEQVLFSEQAGNFKRLSKTSRPY